MKLMPFDAESFYCSKTGYTLSKMTAEEYIRDDRFELIGFSFAPLGQAAMRTTMGLPNTKVWFVS